MSHMAEQTSAFLYGIVHASVAIARFAWAVQGLFASVSFKYRNMCVCSSRVIFVYSMRPSETTHLMLFDLLIVGAVLLIGWISVSTRSQTLLHGNRTLCGIYKRLLGCQVAELIHLNCKHHHAWRHRCCVVYWMEDTKVQTKNSFKQEGSMVQRKFSYHFTKSFAYYGQATSCQPWKALNVHTWVRR